MALVMEPSHAKCNGDILTSCGYACQISLVVLDRSIFSLRKNTHPESFDLWCTRDPILSLTLPRGFGRDSNKLQCCTGTAFVAESLSFRVAASLGRPTTNTMEATTKYKRYPRRYLCLSFSVITVVEAMVLLFCSSCWCPELVMIVKSVI